MFEFEKKVLIKEQKPSQLLIDPDSVVCSQIDVSSLICSICHQILWQPVMCSIPQGCHTYFCTSCIQSWIQNQISKQKNTQQISPFRPTCPQCKHHLILSSPPPLLKCLLSNLKIKCVFNHNGCNEVLEYSSIQQHTFSECFFRNVNCKGCQKVIVWKDYQKHTEECELFIVECEKCCQKMTKKHYKSVHIEKSLMDEKSFLRTVQCYSYQIEHYNKSIQTLQTKTTNLNERLCSLQDLTQRLIKIYPVHLPLTFLTGFTENFAFSNSITSTLIKSSFNLLKKRNQFLHFYIASPIDLNSLLTVQWKLCLSRMKGNILLGFCSSIGGESVDLVVNKYGEVKKKDIKENRYKLVKRVEGFIVEEKDIVRFVYDGRKKLMKISNEIKNVSIELCKEFIELSVQEKQVKSQNRQCMYAFYSMDTAGDQMTFITQG